MLEKPVYGAPCNGCGRCCQQETCPLGYIVFETYEGPCPALEPSGEKLVCGLVANPQNYVPVLAMIRGRETLSAAAGHLIGSSFGCDAYALGEPNFEAVRDRIIDRANSNEKNIRAARIAWNVRGR